MAERFSPRHPKEEPAQPDSPFQYSLQQVGLNYYARTELTPEHMKSNANSANHYILEMLPLMSMQPEWRDKPEEAILSMLRRRFPGEIAAMLALDYPILKSIPDKQLRYELYVLTDAEVRRITHDFVRWHIEEPSYITEQMLEYQREQLVAYQYMQADLLAKKPKQSPRYDAFLGV